MGENPMPCGPGSPHRLRGNEVWGQEPLESCYGLLLWNGTVFAGPTSSSVIRKVAAPGLPVLWWGGGEKGGWTPQCLKYSILRR